MLFKLHWGGKGVKGEAWRELVPRFVEGLGYDRDLAQGLLDVAEIFRRALGRDGRKRLKLLNLSAANRETLLDELDKLARRGWLDDEDADQNAERRAILDLWRGRWLVEAERYGEASRVYLEAERRVPAGTVELGEQLAEALSIVGWKLGWERGRAIPSQDAELALAKAVTLNETEGRHWVGLGVMKFGLGKGAEAAEAAVAAVVLAEVAVVASEVVAAGTNGGIKRFAPKRSPRKYYRQG